MQERLGGQDINPVRTVMCRFDRILPILLCGAPQHALLLLDQVLFQNFKNVGLIGVREYFVIYFKDGTPVTTSFATTASQIDLIFHVVFGDERFDDFQSPVVASTETGTTHADDNLFFHSYRFSSAGYNKFGPETELRMGDSWRHSFQGGSFNHMIASGRIPFPQGSPACRE